MFEHIQTRELNIGEDISISVLARDYPWITEWDWHLDEVTQQAVRIERGTGKKIFLYHEILRHHIGTSSYLPMLDDDSLERAFSRYEELDSYREAIGSFSSLALDFGLEMPPANQILAYSLTTALVMFFNWRDGGVSIQWVEHNDPIEKLSGQGRFLKVPMVEYLTLGHWMFGEHTGEFFEEKEPKTYWHLVSQVLMEAWMYLLSVSNEGKSKEEVGEFWKALVEGAAGTTLAQAMVWAHMLLEKYPVPQGV